MSKRFEDGVCTFTEIVWNIFVAGCTVIILSIGLAVSIKIWKGVFYG